MNVNQNTLNSRLFFHAMGLVVFFLSTIQVNGQTRFLYTLPATPTEFARVMELDPDSRQSREVLENTADTSIGYLHAMASLDADTYLGIGSKSYYSAHRIFTLDKNTGQYSIIRETSGSGMLPEIIPVGNGQALLVRAFYPSGVMLYNGGTGQLEPLDTLPPPFGIIRNAVYDPVGKVLFGYADANDTDTSGYLFSYDPTTQSYEVLYHQVRSQETHYIQSLGIDNGNGVFIQSLNKETYQAEFLYYSLSEKKIRTLRELPWSDWRFTGPPVVRNGVAYGEFRKHNGSKHGLYSLNLYDSTLMDSLSFDTYSFASLIPESPIVFEGDSILRFMAGGGGQYGWGGLTELNWITRQASVLYSCRRSEGLANKVLSYNAAQEEWLLNASLKQSSRWLSGRALSIRNAQVQQVYPYGETEFGDVISDRLIEYSGKKLWFSTTYGGEYGTGGLYTLQYPSYTPVLEHSFGSDYQTPDSFFFPTRGSLAHLGNETLFLLGRIDDQTVAAVYSVTDKRLLKTCVVSKLSAEMTENPYVYQGDFVYFWLRDVDNKGHLFEYDVVQNTVRELTDTDKILRDHSCNCPQDPPVREGDLLYLPQACGSFWGSKESTGFMRIDLNSGITDQIGRSVSLNGETPYGGLVQTADGRIAFVTKSDWDQGFGKLVLYNPAKDTYQAFSLPGTDDGFSVAGSPVFVEETNALYFFCREGGAHSSGTILRFDLYSQKFSNLEDLNINYWWVLEDYHNPQTVAVNPFPTGVTPVKTTGVKVYPNPASDQIAISGMDNPDYSLYGMDGKLIRSGRGNSIEVKGLARGVYVLKLESGSEHLTEKIQVWGP